MAARSPIDGHLKVVRDGVYTLSKLALALQNYTEQLDWMTSPKKVAKICIAACRATSCFR
jgi:hypothetical protein